MRREPFLLLLLFVESRWQESAIARFGRGLMLITLSALSFQKRLT